MIYTALVFLSIAIFFLLIPGMGAYAVRQRWRIFRGRVMKSLALPVYHPGRSMIAADQALECRFYGILEAVEDNDRLWVRDNQSSVAVEVHRSQVFMTPVGSEVDWDSLYVDSMRSLRWERSGVLPEGLGVFVAGTVRLKGGLPSFGGEPGEDPLVIFFDGDPATVLTRAIWFGRQRNEYWNDVSPISLLTGFVALLALALFGFRDEASLYVAVFSAAFSLLPFLPLLPPGIIGFFLYRRLWRQGRTLRARRDLFLLRQAVNQLEPEGIAPIANLPGQRPGPTGHATKARVRILELGGLGVLGVGILVNLYIVLRLIIQLMNNT